MTTYPTRLSIKVLSLLLALSLVYAPITALPEAIQVSAVLAEPDGTSAQDNSGGGAVSSDAAIGIDSAGQLDGNAVVGIGFGEFASTIIGGAINSNPITATVDLVVTAVTGESISTAIAGPPIDFGPIGNAVVGIVSGGPAGGLVGLGQSIIGGIVGSFAPDRPAPAPSRSQAVQQDTVAVVGIWPGSSAESAARSGRDASAISRVYNIMQTSTYTLSCVGADGVTRAVSATVNVR